MREIEQSFRFARNGSIFWFLCERIIEKSRQQINFDDKKETAAKKRFPISTMGQTSR